MTRDALTAKITELRRLALAATPGPWDASDPYTNHCEVTGTGTGQYFIAEAGICNDNYMQAQANAEYIAAANPQVVLAMIDLLAEVSDSAVYAQDQKPGRCDFCYRYMWQPRDTWRGAPCPARHADGIDAPWTPWADWTLEQHALAQGVTPVEDVARLRLPFDADDEETPAPTPCIHLLGGRCGRWDDGDEFGGDMPLHCETCRYRPQPAEKEEGT